MLILFPCLNLPGSYGHSLRVGQGSEQRIQGSMKDVGDASRTMTFSDSTRVSARSVLA
jgi:hypothetical protein